MKDYSETPNRVSKYPWQNNLCNAVNFGDKNIEHSYENDMYCLKNLPNLLCTGY